MKIRGISWLGGIGILAILLLGGCGNSSASTSYQTFTGPKYGFSVQLPAQLHQVSAPPQQPTSDPAAAYPTFRSNDSAMQVNISVTSTLVTTDAYCSKGAHVFVGKIPARENDVSNTQTNANGSGTATAATPTASGTTAASPVPSGTGTPTPAPALDVSTVQFISNGVGYTIQLATRNTSAASVQQHSEIWQHMLNSFTPGKGSNVGPQQCPA